VGFTRSLEEGGTEIELLLDGHRVSVWDEEKVLELVVMAARHCECN